MTSPSSSDSRRRHPSSITTRSSSFAHPSEKTFASFLSLYGHKWEYEPIEFALSWNENGQPTRGFRPDFYLPDLNVFIELTVLEQRLVTKKNAKIRAFRALYPEVELVVVYQKDFNDLVQKHSSVTSEVRAA